MDTCCDWSRDIKFSSYPPSYASGGADVYKPEVLATIETELDKLDPALHSLGMTIHGTCELTPLAFHHLLTTKFPFPDDPELAFEETCASPVVLTLHLTYMEAPLADTRPQRL